MVFFPRGEWDVIIPVGEKECQSAYPSIEAKWMDPILRTMASNQVVAGEDNLCFLDAVPLFFLARPFRFFEWLLFDRRVR